MVYQIIIVVRMVHNIEYILYYEKDQNQNQLTVKRTTIIEQQKGN
jgi:hypothetical protein